MARDVLIAALPVFLKQELLLARVEHRAPSLEAVVEDAYRIADIADKEEKLRHADAAMRRKSPPCIAPYRKHKGINGKCVRCGNLFRPNGHVYDKDDEESIVISQ